MSRTMQLVLGVAAGVLVLQATATSAKDQVERPFRGEATNTWIVSLLDGSAIGHEEGMATHLGLYTNEAVAIWSFEDPQNPAIVSGSGTVMAADDNQVFWKMTADQPGIVQIIGGTGRFENATGSLAAVLPFEEVIVTVDWETMTMTLKITYKAVGTLTY